MLEGVSALVGLPLAVGLAGVDPDGQDPSDLVELAAQWSRVVSWASYQRAEALAALAVQAIDRDGVNAVPAVATEVAMRQAISRQGATRLVRTALQLTGPLQATGEALRRGALDARKADVIAGALEHMPYQVCHDVEDVVLPRAPGRTAPQVAQDVADALIAVDHHEAEARHRSARSRRRVCHPRPLADGMASLYAVLPAADAVALDLALDGAARAAKATGDARTIDQLRADVLAAAGADALTRGGFGLPPDHHPAAPARATTGANASATTPATPAAAGSRTGATASATMTATTDPGAAETTPAGDGPAAATGPEPPPPPAPPPLPAPWFPIGQVGGVPVRINVTVPLTTLLGGDQAGHLDGYGPIDPATARALALGGTWKRLVTDPLTGTVLDLGRTRYRPPPDLAELIRLRDRTCFRPGCGARASGCQLDHTIPFARGGTTSYANLGPGCPTDHPLKTDGHFHVRQTTPGVFEWTSKRTGRTYRREADGTTTALHPHTRQPLTPPEDAPPPF